MREWWVVAQLPRMSILGNEFDKKILKNVKEISKRCKDVIINVMSYVLVMSQCKELRKSIFGPISCIGHIQVI